MYGRYNLPQQILGLSHATAFLARIPACRAHRAWLLRQSDPERQRLAVLRTQAMVGAQSCRITGRFNAFATRFRGELTTEGRALQDYYQKNHGKRGDAALDEFVTQLSNAPFVDGNGTGDYCGATKALLNDATSEPVGHLAAFSHERP